MKMACILLLMSLVTLSIGCGGSKSFNGTWEMISPAPDDPSAIPNVKILSDTHFAFGTRSGEGGAFAGGGTYTFSDSTYTEFVQYHSLNFLVGQRLEFRYLLEDDKWYHTGTFDIDGRRFSVNEVWQRIEK